MSSGKKIIAVDSDEVLAGFIDGFIEYNKSKYATKITREDVVTFELGHLLGMPEHKIEERIREFFTSGEARKIKTITGAKEGIDELLKRGYEIHVITSRPIPLKEETLRWLDEHFPNKFISINFAFNPYVLESKQKTKAEICLEINTPILIEDNLQIATDCAKNGIKILLMNTLWNQSGKLPKNMRRAKNWKEILEILT